MIRTSLHLSFLDGSNTSWPAPEGPGWYIWATDAVPVPPTHMLQPFAVIPLVRLPSGDAVKFAKVADKLIEGKALHAIPGMKNHDDYSSLEQAILGGNEKAKDLIQRELAEAERAVRNLQILKQRAQEFGADADGSD
jgi:hypothetical protein